MLRRETVVDGDDDCGEFTGQSLAKVVVGFRIGTEECKPSSMEEDNDRKLDDVVNGGGGRGCGCVEAEPKVAGGVDGDIRGCDTVGMGLFEGGDFRSKRLKRRRLMVTLLRREASETAERM
ncbi:hypothetical protein ACOSQ4_009126 [Xanthoceras sorbifolium]